MKKFIYGVLSVLFAFIVLAITLAPYAITGLLVWMVVIAEGTLPGTIAGSIFVSTVGLIISLLYTYAIAYFRCWKLSNFVRIPEVTIIDEENTGLMIIDRDFH
ncbi:MAG: hypothetical protein FWE01_03485 [Firmicutes bacterium]|nr:hypothetical protein [Bacillota bacterium]